jgi:tetratricopeptide (TPR) repeat protein
VVLALLLVAAGGVGGWLWWRGPTPALPEISLQESEPAVAQAIEAAREEVQRQPRSGAAWGKLGQVLLAHDLADPAVTCFIHAERFDPDNPRWPYLRALILQFHDPEAAVPALRRAAELCDISDKDNLTPRLRLGETLLQLGRAEEARAEFEMARARVPGNARALYGLGLAAAALGDLEEARGHLQACSGSPQTQQKAAAELAKVFMRQGDTEGAARAERQSRKLPPDRDWPDLYAAQTATLKVSRQDQFRRAKELVLRGNRAEGIALLRRLVDEKPDSHAYLELGLALAKSRDNRGAEAALRQAAGLDPDRFGPAHLLNVLIFERAEQSRTPEPLQEAVVFGRRAVQLRPDHAFAHLYLGLALKGLGQRQQAVEAFRAAVRCAPDKPDPYLHLAEALAEDGQKDEARRLMERATRLSISPNDARPQQTLKRLQQLLARP